MLTVLGGIQFQISPGPYEVTSVNNLLSSGLSGGRRRADGWDQKSMTSLGASLRRVSGLGEACLELSFEGSLGCMHTVVVASGKEGYRTWLLAATGVIIDLDRYKAPLSKISWVPKAPVRSFLKQE